MDAAPHTMLALSITSCCSSDCERPHRCCHLPNNFVSHQTFPILRRDMPLNCPLLWGLPPTRGHTSMTGLANFVVSLLCPTSRHRNTQRPRNIGNNRPHLMLQPNKVHGAKIRKSSEMHWSVILGALRASHICGLLPLVL